MTRAVLSVALAALCSLLTASPAGAAKPRIYAFDVLDARISEVMTFQSDDGPACQRAGLCGYSGTVTYEFGHADGFAIALAQGRHVNGFGGIEMGGLTTATVQGPGGGTPCTDKVIDRSDSFDIEGRTARPRLVFHAPSSAPQFLNSYCPGPRDVDVARLIPALALPSHSLGRRSLFAQTAASKQFHAGPFVGTLSFSVAVRMRRSPSLGGLLEIFG